MTTGPDVHERDALHLLDEAVANDPHIRCDSGDRSKIARAMLDALTEAGLAVVVTDYAKLTQALGECHWPYAAETPPPLEGDR